MATNLPDVILELKDAKAKLEFTDRGLEEYIEVPVNQEKTLPIVKADDVLYDQRTDLLGKAIEALENLVKDGHPGIPVHLVDQDVLDDLKLKADQMLAALATYAAKEVTALRIEVEGIQDSPQ